MCRGYVLRIEEGEKRLPCRIETDVKSFEYNGDWASVKCRDGRGKLLRQHLRWMVSQVERVCQL